MRLAVLTMTVVLMAPGCGTDDSGGTAGSGGAAGSGGSGGAAAGAGGAAASGGTAAAGGTAAGSGGTGASAGSGGSAASAGNGGSGPNTNLPPLTGEGVETLVGVGVPGTWDGEREYAHLNNPVNVKLGPDGDLYVADFDNWRIRRVTPAGDVSTWTQAEGFGRPFGLTFDVSGTLFVQTDYNSAGAPGGALWRIGASGTPALEVDEVGRPRGLAALSDGRLVMSYFLDNRLSIYNPATKQVSPLAGSATGEAGFVDGSGGAARFSFPYGIVVTSTGQILVADQGNHVIRQVTTAGVVTTYAGTGAIQVSDGGLAQAAFNGPQGLAIDGDDNVYVSESGGAVIRKISAGQVTTIAGTGAAGFRDDADPMLAQFFGMEGLALSADGTKLYVADGNRGEGGPFHRVRIVHLN